jgi:3-dehydroquinate synthase
LNKHSTATQIVVISNEPIFKLHGEKLMDHFNSKQKMLPIFVPDSENAKSFDQVQTLYTKLLENKIERSALILAFGGGVIGDLAGFIAATYLRGVSFAQIPTTFLAQVDSSIGGKVGINHPLGKNLIGAFKQPLFVLGDTKLLGSLPDAEIRCGLGEVIKYGLVLNKTLFEYLDKNLEKALNKDPHVLLNLVKVSSEEKAKVVAKDEQEKDLRMVLNFGHTFGHALEADFKFGQLKHGEAVILGMKCAFQYALNNKLVSVEEYNRSIALLNRIPILFNGKDLNLNTLIHRMTIDKKVKDGNIRLVLPDGIGNYRFQFAENFTELEKAFKILAD